MELVFKQNMENIVDIYRVAQSFFGNNFYKNKEIFKIISPQILEVYRILLVGTTLESMM